MPSGRSANITIIHGGRGEGKRKIDSSTANLLELNAQNVSISCSGLTSAVAKCTSLTAV